MNSVIYLSGPITGCSYEECNDWRAEAKKTLEEVGYRCYSPMRGKEAFKHIRSFAPHGYDGVASNKRIFSRDSFDVHRADILLVNLVGAKQISIGTMFEMAWGHKAGKFVLTVMEESNPHDHAFVREASSMIVDELKQAVDYLKHVLNA